MPSGVDWLGEVPEHWEVKRLKYAASINDEALPETTDPTSEIIYVDIGSVDADRGITNRVEILFEDAPSRARRIVRDGDTIVSTVRTYLRAIAAIRDPEPNTIVSTGFAVVRPQRVHPIFMSYALREMGFVDAVVAQSVGVSYPAINASEIGTLPIPLPPAHEQRAIANFLDRETATVDSLVAAKRALVERLKEKRNALISRTLTRGLPSDAAIRAGLDPNPKLNASGIDWIGELPEGWDVRPLKRCVRFIEGPGIMASDFCDSGVPLLRIAGIAGRMATLEGCNYLDPNLVVEKWEHLRVRRADLLISGSASTGYCSEVDETTEGAIPYTGIIIMRPLKQLTKSFTRWFLSSELFQIQAELARSGSTIQHFGPSHLSRMVVVVPPVREQHAIASFLDHETAQIDEVGGEIEAAIECLQEYRSALITAAISGKIDVRGATA